MAQYYTHITGEQMQLIKSSPLFFVGTSAQNSPEVLEGLGAINISPKGSDILHILDQNHVAYLDYAGSGNETARHLNSGSPITIMICSFEEDNAAIVRLYGTAKTESLEQSSLAKELLEHASKELKLSPRQVINMTIEKTTTSCGYGVPVMNFIRDRRVSDRGRLYKK
ncbi:MAG: hypothetical protein U0Z26_04010 [Anaerolineales bacterium]